MDRNAAIATERIIRNPSAATSPTTLPQRRAIARNADAVRAILHDGNSEIHQ